MKRFLVPFVALALLGIILPVAAEELPHLLLVKGLRDRGDHDLALDYLQTLAKRTPPVPPELKAILPLEIARTQAGMALRERQATVRAARLRQARQGIQAFVAANPKHEMLGEAQLDLARATMEQGRAQAFAAQEAGEAEAEKIGQEARKTFDEAEAAFATAVKTLEARLKEAKDADLQRAYASTVYHRGLSLYEKALSYGEDISKREERTKVTVEASKILEPLTEKPEAQPAGIGWQATALFARCLEEMETPDRPYVLYQRVLSQKDPAADVAKREVLYYRFLSAQRGSYMVGPKRVVPTPAEVRKMGEEWPSPFKGTTGVTPVPPGSREDPYNTREGQHIRFLLARAYLDEIRGLDKQQLQASQNLVRRARELFEGLENSSSEYAQLAEDGKLMVILLSGEAGGSISSLHNFDECYVRALLEARSASNAPSAEAIKEQIDKVQDDLKKATKDEEKKALQKDLDKLKNDAASLATYEKNRSQLDQLEADWRQAKTLAEREKLRQQIGKLRDEMDRLPAKPQGAHIQMMLEAARQGVAFMPRHVAKEKWERIHQLLFLGYARTADVYRAALLADFLAHHTTNEELAPDYALEALRLYHRIAERKGEAADIQRRDSIGQWMEQKWPTAAATDNAREIMGTLLAQKAGKLLEERKQPEAQALYRDAAAAWARVSKGYTKYALCSYQAAVIYWNLHLTGVRDSKKPINTPSKDLEQALALLERTRQATASKPGAKMNDTEVQATLLLAQIHSFLKDTKKSLELVDPLVDRLEKKELPDTLPEKTNGDILGLALLQHVQQKNTERALAVLKVLEAHGKADERLARDLPNILLNMGAQLRGQIAALEKEGPDSAKQLEETKASFRAFLDHLQKNSPPLNKESTTAAWDLRAWLGSNYAMLGDHANAAQVFATIPDPDPPLSADKLREYVKERINQVQAKQQKATTDEEKKTLQRDLSRLQKATGSVAALSNLEGTLQQAQTETERRKLRTQSTKLREEIDQLAGNPNEPDPQKIKAHQRSQLLRIRSLRLGKQLDEADKLVKQLKELAWSERHPEVLKEEILIIQDQKNYSEAIPRWTKFIQALQPHTSKNPLISEIYYEAEFQLIFCMYMEAKQLDKAEQAKGILQAAQRLVTFEKSKPNFGGPDHQKRVHEFLDDPEHQDIRDQFEKLRGSGK